MDKDIAIDVSNVTKLYKLYDRPKDRLTESLGLSRKKHYTEHYALHDISFSVKKGESIGIIGTNGAGKSTILKIITGVLSPTEGSVDIDGRISALLELGAGFNMEYTGIENIYLNAAMIGFTREETDARLDDIIKFADIGEFINQPVKMYSSGMFVRLAFAVAINIDPEILIVDEALSVGDVYFQAKCFNKFEEFRKQGKTILFVSHDLSSIKKYCSRAILLDHGHKVGEGSPAEMIDVYKKILVGLYNPEEASIDDINAAADKVSGIDEMPGIAPADPEAKDGRLWRSSFALNPERQVYGDLKVEIKDFAIEDMDGNLTTSLLKGDEFVIKVKLHANADVEDPISSYTFKTVKGTDVTGTNTKFEGCDIGPMKAGDERVITFRQRMNLQGGQYLLSLGTTRYEDAAFKVSNRLYDIVSIDVISEKNTVGFYDMESEITIS